MQSFSAALTALKTSCCEYDESLKKTIEINGILKASVDKMAGALDEMKKMFSQGKCDVCCQREKDNALECGHCLCSVCAIRALRSGRCPFCRKTVNESIKLYR